MEYAWGMFFWFLLVMLVVWSTMAWWPGRGRYRGRFYAEYPEWDYPYGPVYSRFSRNRRPRRTRGPKNYRRPDERIAADINDRYLVDDELDATDIEVRVEGGTVTLSGNVRDRGDKRLAEWLADSVPGVVDIKNELVVKTMPEERPGDRVA